MSLKKEVKNIKNGRNRKLGETEPECCRAELNIRNQSIEIFVICPPLTTEILGCWSMERKIIT